MLDVNRNALIGLGRMVVFLPALVFLPAWTVHYWQAWLCLSVFFICVTAITVYLMKANPALLARRLKAGAAAEQQTSQKVIQAIATVAFVAMFVVPAIDHRFGWSQMPIALVVTGDLLIVAGFAFVLWVFKVNSFTSGIIEVNPEQEVISSGPYAFVRHPMYLGSLIMLLGIPLGLGSIWGLLTIVLMTAIIVVRLIDEESFLAKNLRGYAEYTQTVKYRLAPFVW